MNNRNSATAAFFIAAAMFGSSAAAQVADDAAALLKESAEAIKAVTGVSYKAKLYGLGPLKPIMDGEADVKLVRNTINPKMSTVWVKGSVAEIGKGRASVFVTANPRTIRWQDDPQNTVFERPANDRNDAQRVFGLGSQVLMQEFTEMAPFAKDLAASKLDITGTADVHGENCKIVVASWDNGVRSTTWWISAKDKLPRKVELTHGANNPDVEKRLAKGTEIWDLKADPSMKEADFFIVVPNGYKEDKQDAPVAPKVQNNDLTNPQLPAGPVPDPILGLAVGTEAPDFDLTDTASKAVKLSSAKGNVVVLSFGGSRFPKSTLTNGIVQKLSESYNGKNVKFYGVACREASNQDATDFVKGQKWTFPTLLDGDKIVNNYKVVGFPAVYVLGTDGKVSKFFQGPVTKDEIDTAIQEALKPASK